MNSIDNGRKQIVEFDEFKTRLEKFKKRYSGVVYDLSDPEQEKQARSDRYAIGKVVSALDLKHKELKAPLKARTDLIDENRKEIKDELLQIQNKIKEQIKIRESEIRAHAEMLQGKIDKIKNLGVFSGDTDSDTIFKSLSLCRGLEIDEAFEDRKADAALAQLETVKKLEFLLAERKKAEAEQIELDRLRAEAEKREREDREEKIRREAVEKERCEAEAKAQQERDRVYAERLKAEAKATLEVEDAKRKQREAEERACRAAQDERERIENEQLEAETKRQAEIKAEEARKAKQTHRTKIHREIKQSFVNSGMSEENACFAADLIKDGKINNVTINY